MSTNESTRLAVPLTASPSPSPFVPLNSRYSVHDSSTMLPARILSSVYIGIPGKLDGKSRTVSEVL